MSRLLRTTFAFGLIAGPSLAIAQPPATPQATQQTTPPARAPRPQNPTRDPHTAGYVTAKELPDGDNAPANADGDFIIGPTHNRAPEMTAQDNVQHGTVQTF